MHTTIAGFEQVIIKNSRFADFEQVISKNSHFPYFEQAKSYFTDFEQVKKTNSKTPVGETGCLCIAFFFTQPPLVFRPILYFQPR